MKIQFFILALVAVLAIDAIEVRKVENDELVENRDESLSVKQIEDNDVIAPAAGNSTKPKCNLEYLACVKELKKKYPTRKAHLKCGFKFIRCKKMCYKKCFKAEKRCLKKHKDQKEKCKAELKECTGKCPHLSKCARQCKMTLEKCKKKKGAKKWACLKKFISCVKKCKPKGGKYGKSQRGGWYSYMSQ